MRPDEHVHYRVDLACKNEAEAKEQAGALVDGFDVELWQLDNATSQQDCESARQSTGGCRRCQETAIAKSSAESSKDGRGS